MRVTLRQLREQRAAAARVELAREDDSSGERRRSLLPGIGSERRQVKEGLAKAQLAVSESMPPQVTGVL
jgi:hypothetical protein